ncbi:MAG: carboxypeptidase regulatory-like domain-containing protein [Thermoplasmatota archaeon]
MSSIALATIAITAGFLTGWATAQSAVAPGTALISGVVTEVGSGNPLFALVTAQSGSGVNATGTTNSSTKTDSNGYYSIRAPLGSVVLTANATDGEHYGSTQKFTAFQDQTVNFQLEPKEVTRNATLAGIVTDSATHAPIAGATITLSRDYFAPEAAAAPSNSASSGGAAGASTSGSAMIAEPCCGSFSTQTAADGSYHIEVPAGSYRVGFSASNYGYDTVQDNLSAGANRLDHALVAYPPYSALITGTVTDASTGEPVSGAAITIEVPSWSQFNSTESAADGTFSLRTIAGLAHVHVSAYHYHVPPCVEATSASSGGANSPTGAMPIRCGYTYTGPAHSYYTWTTSIRAVNGTVSLSISLTRKPEPTQLVEGYVVDSATGKAVPGAWVYLYNEDNAQGGSVMTDANGSYRAYMFPGHISLGASAQNYFENDTTIVLGSQSALRIDLVLDPGVPHSRYGSCCYYPGIAYASTAGSSSGASSPGATSATPSDAARSAALSASGDNAATSNASSAYIGAGGSLGAFNGQTVTSPEGSATQNPSTGQSATPAAPLSLVLLSVAGVAVLAAARRRGR